MINKKIALGLTAGMTMVMVGTANAQPVTNNTEKNDKKSQDTKQDTQQSTQENSQQDMQENIKQNSSQDTKESAKQDTQENSQKETQQNESQETKQSSQQNKDQEVKRSSQQDIQLDSTGLGVQFTGVTTDVNGNAATSADAGSVITINVGTSLSSNGLQVTSYPNAHFVCNPTITFTGSPTAQQEQEAQALTSQIQTQVSALNNINSTSSFTGAINIIVPNNIQANMVLNPNISLDINGKSYNVNVNQIDLIPSSNKSSTTISQGGQGTISDLPNGVSPSSTPIIVQNTNQGDIQGNANGFGIDTNQNTYQTQMTGFSNSYKVYSGAFVQGAIIGVYDIGSQTSGINSMYTANQIFVALNENSTNIMSNGTATEKENLMQKIINNDSSVGIFYTYNELVNMQAASIDVSGNINFVYQENLYTPQENNTSVFYGYVNIVQAYNKGQYESNPTSIIGQNTVIKTIGIAIQSDDVNTTDKEVITSGISNVDIYNNNILFLGNTNVSNSFNGSVQRFGQNNIVTNDATDINATTCTVQSIDSDTISYNNNQGVYLPQDPKAWLQQQHTIQFVYTTNYPIVDSNLQVDYLKGTKLYLDMVGTSQSAQGVMFNTSSININGNIISLNSVEALPDGKIVITLPEDINVYTSGNSSTNPLSVNITGTYDLEYSTAPNVTLNIGFDNPTYPYAEQNGEFYMPQSSATLQSCKLVMAVGVNNSTIHEVTQTNENQQATLTDQVHNQSGSAERYIVEGEIPQAVSNTLTGNMGFPSQGGLSSSLLSIDNPTNAPIWLLPNSDISKANNEELLRGKNPDVLKGVTGESLENQGWVKYTPGMNLSSYIGYIAMPTIQPNSNWKFKYTVQLNGVNSNEMQYDTSAFKYYQEATALGSKSNIVIIAPANANLSSTWNSAVMINNESVNIAQLPSQLKTLINSGSNSNDGFNMTPQALMNLVNLANNSDLLNKLGYKLENITVQEGNEPVINANTSWFENQGILGVSAPVHVEFYLKTTTENGIVTVKNNKGKILSDTEVTVDGVKKVTNAQGQIIVPNMSIGENKKLSITSEGYNPTTVSITATANGANAIAELTPQTGGTIVKVVDSKTGLPIAGATVSIDGKTMKTNSEGDVTVQGLEPSAGAKVDATDPDYSDGTGTVPIESNKTSTVTIPLTPKNGTATIKVINGNTQKPMVDQPVVVDGNPMTTNADGDIIVPNLPEGSHKITVTEPNANGGETTVDVPAGENVNGTVTITPHKGSAKITVINTNTGKPL
ncbi:MAG: hypothetical protein ACRC57_11515, partial [Sarcina sp.]